MATGKWITDLTASTPVPDAARRVLAIRLEVVRDFLGLALHESDKDPENIHQLRVGTRRAGAALDIFAQCLPDKAYRTARKQLRRLRRAAGAIRDWDVFLEALSERSQQPSRRHRAGLDFLIGYAFSQRTLAQSAMDSAGTDYPFAFERFLTATLADIAPPATGTRTLLALARPLLSGLVAELDAAAGQDLNDYNHLHQVRIVGKRLRYAMEIFTDCFEPAFQQELYPAVEEMQEFLGRANDSHVASQRLATLRVRLQEVLPDAWKRFKPGIEGLLRFHDQRLPEERQRFLQWWERWRTAGGEVAFVNLLKKPEAASS